MIRSPLGITFLAGMIVFLACANAAGREDAPKKAGGADEPEKVGLDELKSNLLRKMIRAHAEAFAREKDQAARAKVLADVFGGAGKVHERLNYAYKNDKPVVELDATKVIVVVPEDQRDAALVAVRELLGYSLNRVAEGQISDGDKKYTLAKEDARAIRGAVRILWPAAPPADPNRAIAARLDQIIKDLETIKKLQPRLDKLERDLPQLNKKLDLILKDLDNLKKLEARLDRLEKAAPGVLKRIDDLTAEVKRQAEELRRQDKALADTNAALKRQIDETKALGDRLRKLDEEGKKRADDLKALQDRVKQDEDERKKLDERLKKLESSQSPSCPPYSMSMPPCQWTVVDQGNYSLQMVPGCGGMGECFPVLSWVWIPCPVLVPVQPESAGQMLGEPTPDAPKMNPAENGKPKEKKEAPKKEVAPTGDGPSLPELNSTTSVVRLASTGERPHKARRAQPSVPVFNTAGLTATDAMDVFLQGRKQYYSGQRLEALSRFDAAVKLFSDDARFWYFKSLCESDLGDSLEAAKSLRRAVDLHLQGKPNQAAIGAALERIQGQRRLNLRAALDAQRGR